MQPPPIRTKRLELRPMTPAFLEPLLAGRREDAETALDASLPDGWPDAHDTGFLRLRLDQMRAEPARLAWPVLAMALDGAFIGHLGFHGPPGVNSLRRGDAVEIGYSVLPPHRRNGFATEAVEGLLEWAERERDIRVFIASVAPDNEPSLAIIRRLGFVHVGEHWDEQDGRELEFLLELPAASPAC
ncbi:MAG: GNAT family N-acetyltransferase [Gaiellaceae bacterium]